jgi:hypothetical protein
MMSKFLSTVIIGLTLLLAWQVYHRFGGAAVGPGLQTVRSLSPELLSQVELLPVSGQGPEAVEAETVFLRHILGPRCTLLYFFHPHCPACENAAPSWRGVASISQGDVVVDVRWIALENAPSLTSEFLTRHDLDLDSYVLKTEGDHHRLGIEYWPQSRLLGPRGQQIAHGGHLPSHLRERITEEPALFEACEPPRAGPSSPGG